MIADLTHRRRRRVCGAAAHGGWHRSNRPGPSRSEPPAPWKNRSRPCRNDVPTHEPGCPDATTAFMSRAPSRCMARLCERAHRAISAMLGHRVNPPAPAIMGVFQPDEPGPDVVHVVSGPDGVAHVVERQQAAITFKRPRRHARQPGDAAGLPDVNMRRRRARAARRRAAYSRRRRSG